MSLCQVSITHPNILRVRSSHKTMLVHFYSQMKHYEKKMAFNCCTCATLVCSPYSFHVPFLSWIYIFPVPFSLPLWDCVCSQSSLWPIYACPLFQFTLPYSQCIFFAPKNAYIFVLAQSKSRKHTWSSAHITGIIHRVSLVTWMWQLWRCNMHEPDGCSRVSGCRWI